MDVIVRSNNNPDNDMTAHMSEHINDLNKVVKTKSSQSLFGKLLQRIVKVDIQVTNRTNKTWKFIYVVKVRQLFSKHRVSKIVLPVWLRAVQTENVVCCAA